MCFPEVVSLLVYFVCNVVYCTGDCVGLMVFMCCRCGAAWQTLTASDVGLGACCCTGSLGYVLLNAPRRSLKLKLPVAVTALLSSGATPKAGDSMTADSIAGTSIERDWEDWLVNERL